MRHSIITALGVCLVASFTACGNKQTKDAEAVDSTAIKDTIVSEKVEPTKKMSKSDENPNACILILDDRDTIIRKFKRAVTDSDSTVRYAEGKDGINNLMTIYSSLTGKDYAAIEQEFAGKGYGDFKMAVGETVADHLQPIQDEFKKLFADKAYLKQCYTDGAAKALAYSQRIVSKVYHKVGFVDAR